MSIRKYHGKLDEYINIYFALTWEKKGKEKINKGDPRVLIALQFHTLQIKQGNFIYDNFPIKKATEATISDIL